MDLAREEEIRLVKDEFNRFIISYDHDSFVLNCEVRSRLLIEDHRDGARFIANAALRALGRSEPLLMVRIGDGEANLLRFALHHNEFELQWVNAVFLMHDNQTLPIEDAKRLSRELSALLAGADIIGLRAFGPNPSDVQIRKISEAIDRKDLRAALGMIEALQYGDRAVKNAEFRKTVLTSAWVHLGLLEHLHVLLDNARRVVVITGRHELERLFSEKLKNRLAAFLPVPVQASDQSSPERPFHYPTRYNEIIEALRTDLRGTLVLAGAGIFGKKYCATARHNGAVALDLGSAFDLLAGKITRPVHSNRSIIDPNHGPWIKTSQALRLEPNAAYPNTQRQSRSSSAA
jgi:hypothetical protein